MNAIKTTVINKLGKDVILSPNQMCTPELEITLEQLPTEEENGPVNILVTLKAIYITDMGLTGIMECKIQRALIRFNR